MKSSGPIACGTRRRSVAARQRERGETAVLIVVLIAIFTGIVWWLFASRAGTKRDAREFARVAATRLAFDLDRKFLDRVIAPEQVTRYPPSFRERMVARLRGFGRPLEPVEVDGDVFFQSYFFQPTATFRAELKYPNMPATLYFSISRPRGWWQIDEMNLWWEQPPPPDPATASPRTSPAR